MQIETVGNFNIMVSYQYQINFMHVIRYELNKIRVSITNHHQTWSFENRNTVYVMAL